MSGFGLAQIYALSAVLMTGVGHVLVKQASTRAKSGLLIFADWRLIAGYALLFGMVLLHQLSLHGMTLRELSIWITLTHPLTIGLSVVWLHERIGRRELIGLLILVTGLIVFASGNG